MKRWRREAIEIIIEEDRFVIGAWNRCGSFEVQQWPDKVAKSKFCELVQTALRVGPQLLTKQGEDVAVLVPIGLWRRLQCGHPPTLKDLLLGDGPRFHHPLPMRGQFRRRLQ